MSQMLQSYPAAPNGKFMLHLTHFMLNPVVTVANLEAVLLASLAVKPVVLGSAALGASKEVDCLLATNWALSGERHR